MGADHNKNPVAVSGHSCGLNIRLAVLFLIQLNLSLFPCTVFCVKTAGNVYGGSNEDWCDPLSLVTFISPVPGKYGWVRFSYKSRFPQGGMNEHGLFWDATAVPYLDMPEAVVHKKKYAGALMNKVMEECRTVAEAVQVFKGFYCEDQFRSQYLLGDSSGDSVIVEGDTILRQSSDFQLVTNFYQSFPELGGYPCERFNSAKNILQGNEYEGFRKALKALEVTRQTGHYSTQYSCIFQPRERLIHVFWFHNFNEFITLSIESGMTVHDRELDIPLQFSSMSIVSPGDGSKFRSGEVKIRWEGKTGSTYEVVCSDQPDFSGFTESIPVQSDADLSSILFWPLVTLTALLRKTAGRKAGRSALFIIVLMIPVLMNNCRVSHEDPVSEVSRFSADLKGLRHETTYYWKIRARAERSDVFSETIVRSFRIL